MNSNSVNPFKFTPFPGSPSWAPSSPSKSPSPEQNQPFKNPDVFQPAYPTGPDGHPEFPKQPIWLPPSPALPNVEVPNEFPIELPSFPNAEEWTPSPSPIEIPDWSKTPSHFPGPSGPEIEMPSHFPPAKSPDGMWLLS